MSNEFKGRSGIDRIIRAAGHSASGLHLAYTSEAAFRQEVWLAALLLPASLWLGEGWVQVTLLAGSVLMVLIVELLNSAVEAAIDRVSYDWHELSKRAKDLGSAAVMLALLLCAGIWMAAVVHRLLGA